MSTDKNPKDKQISRRKFILRAGLGTAGVVALGTYLFRNPIRRELLQYMGHMDPPYMGNKKDPMVWFELTRDNKVILHSPKVEMGQGIFTGLAQLAAEELDVDMDQIQVVHASTASGNIDGFSTGGSTSMASLWGPLRELAATLRELIKNEAAGKMGLPPGELSTGHGLVYGGEAEMTYARAMEGGGGWKIPDTPKLRDPATFKHIGKPVPRLDLRDKIFGEPVFGMDAEVPGVLYGAVVRPPKIGAKFKGADTSRAAQMPGVVKIVQETDFVGVVASSWMEAQNAKEAIVAEWEVEKDWQTSDILEMISVGNGKDYVIQTQGRAKKHLSAGEVIRAEFRSPLGAHAQLEPNGALALVEADQATITISTQVVSLTRKEVAERLGMDREKVNIIPTYLGGGFGRRLHTPHAVHAALMSRAVGRPVKYFFTRKEEFQHDMFRPPTHHVLKARLNPDGSLEAFEHQFASGDVAYHSALLPGILNQVIGADVGAIRGGFIQYSGIPNFRAVSWHTTLPFATSWWRSLGLLANTFAIESFMDELAIRAGRNAVDFRLDHIQDASPADRRLREVIRVAAERSGYREDPVNGVAMGFAVSVDAGTPCAQVAEVSIRNNEIRVERVTCVMDPGFAVNPDQVRAQCEGSIIMGLSASLYEEMYVEDGALRPVIYGPYRMALMKNTPREIEVFLLQGREVPGAVGEPPLGPIGAAVANAVYRLTGQRLRKLPLKLG